MVKKIISLFISMFILFDIVYANEIDLDSERYILYNLNDNQIILKEKEDEEVSIASLTKIMTVIVAIENINDFNEKVTITEDMIKDIERDVSVVGFEVGEEVTYDDLLYSSILASGADAVNALAFSISGNLDDYLTLMNNKAMELGLNHTHYANVIGLYDSNNYSSAYDQAQLLMYAIKNPKFKTVFETKKYILTNGTEIRSTLDYYSSNEDVSFITGSKTGYIKAAGYCLATTATLNNVNYLLITLNAPKVSGIHVRDHINTYNYFNNNYSYKNIVNYNDVVATINVKNTIEKYYNVYSSVNINKYLKNDFEKSNVTYEYNGKNDIDYFTPNGEKLGTVKIIYNGEILDEIDVNYNRILHLDYMSFLTDNISYVLMIVVVLSFLIIIKIRK